MLAVHKALEASLHNASLTTFWMIPKLQQTRCCTCQLPIMEALASLSKITLQLPSQGYLLTQT